MYPRIIADLDRLRENMERMTALCHAHGLTAALVSKCVCADARIAGLMAEAGADFLADSPKGAGCMVIDPAMAHRPLYLLLQFCKGI
mgnify:CR=1 FL=1